MVKIRLLVRDLDPKIPVTSALVPQMRKWFALRRSEASGCSHMEAHVELEDNCSNVNELMKVI